MNFVCTDYTKYWLSTYETPSCCCGSQNMIFWQTFFIIYSIVFLRRKTVMQVWNDMRMSECEWMVEFYFLWTVPLMQDKKDFDFDCYLHTFSHFQPVRDVKQMVTPRPLKLFALGTSESTDFRTLDNGPIKSPKFTHAHLQSHLLQQRTFSILIAGVNSLLHLQGKMMRRMKIRSGLLVKIADGVTPHSCSSLHTYNPSRAFPSVWKCSLHSWNPAKHCPFTNSYYLCGLPLW